MDPLPAAKFQAKPWRYNRKRRRSGTESAETEGDGKMVKKDADGIGAIQANSIGIEKMDTDNTAK